MAKSVAAVLCSGAMVVGAGNVARDDAAPAPGRTTFVSRMEGTIKNPLDGPLSETEFSMSRLSSGITSLHNRIDGSGVSLQAVRGGIDSMQKRVAELERQAAESSSVMQQFQVRLAVAQATRVVVEELWNDISARRLPDRRIRVAEYEARVLTMAMLDLYGANGVAPELFVSALPDALQMSGEERVTFLSTALEAKGGTIALKADRNALAMAVTEKLVGKLGGDPSDDALSKEVQSAFQRVGSVIETAVQAEVVARAEAPTMDKLPMPRYPHGPQPTPEFPDDFFEEKLKDKLKNKALDWAVKKTIEKLTGIKPSLPLGLLLPAPALNVGSELPDNPAEREVLQMTARMMWEMHRTSERYRDYDLSSPSWDRDRGPDPLERDGGIRGYDKLDRDFRDPNNPGGNDNVG